MGYHLSPSNYDRNWTCSECSKPIAAIPGRFKIYNRNQLTCSKACAAARKVRLQAERRAKKQANNYGGRPAAFKPDPDRSASARRRETYKRTA